jgi:hypothetical protein
LRAKTCAAYAWNRGAIDGASATTPLRIRSQLALQPCETAVFFAFTSRIVGGTQV